jgi:UDP-GlcNAc:undecaprenyl-phosphate GlcNAc-1-phosphate transferase
VNELHYLQAGAAFALALGVSLVGMPVAVVAGRRFDMVVHPRLFGKGRAGVSYLGGSALAVAVGVAFMVSGRGFHRQVATFFIAALVVLLLGIADDRSKGGGVPIYLRIGAEAGAAGFLVWGGLRPHVTGRPVVDAALTIFVLVAAANAFNLLDNMDGVAGATAAAASAGLFGLAAMGDQWLVAVMAAGLCGASLGFLRHNLMGPRVFLGNGGSLFLGFLIGATALKLRLPVQGAWGLVAAIAVLAVPAMDTSVVVMSRLLAHRSPFEGGVDHLSHRLVLMGVSTRGAAMMHAAGAALGAGGAALAVLLARNEPLIAFLAVF